jgi:hypothetical protein
MQHEIFLSYSRKDSDVMHRVRNDLRASGLTTWTDDGIDPGSESWKLSIETAIKNAGCLVAILSPDSAESRWVRAELDFAEAQKKKVFLLLVRGDASNAVPFGYSSHQWIDIRHSGLYEPGLRQLTDVIRQHLNIDGQGGAAQRAEPVRSHMGAAVPDQLEFYNFFDQLRLVRWLFLEPATVMSIQTMGGETSIRQTAAWVVSALAWLPFLTPTVGYALGTLQTPGTPPITTPSLLAAWGLMLLGWFINGWFGWRKGQTPGLALLVISLALSLITFQMIPNMAAVLHGTSDANLLPQAVFLISVGVFLGTAAGIAFHLANGTTGSLAGIVIASVINSTLSGYPLGILGGVAGLAVLGMAFGVSTAIEQNLKTEKRSPLGIVMLGIALLTGGAMLWAYLLGGWQVLLR